MSRTDIFGVPPLVETPADHAQPFDRGVRVRRHPRQTKGIDYKADIDNTGKACCSEPTSADARGACCGDENVT